ncbi:MAG: glycosyltransferase family 4 protein [Bacteroidetes bacterium]|nr:glycosyltransferase family 4 protein [Bacteroidota bacterium]MBL6962459.1 glycosyltransferase family 4 protein [Bacteroidota bacterium]
MKIINIVPGFGGTFYCGNCLRDSAYIKTLDGLGHEAISLPIYLPLRTDNGLLNRETPVFYGAINIYLEQQIPFLRKMPEWMEKFFNSRIFLRYAAKKAGSTRAKGLEGMTISMLKGHEGYQREELNHLIEFLKAEKPDMVHLSNALLLGLAYKIKHELNISVVCSLQDEDVWVDAMSENYKDKVWKLMSQKAKDVDAFVAVSHYYAELMKKKMSIRKDQLHVVHIGVNPANYKYHNPNLATPTIGYLSRINKENGFEVLVDAFIKLKQKPGFKNVNLKVTGGKTGDDKRFINKQIRKLEKHDFVKDVEFIEDYRHEKLEEFFKSLTLLSVPVLSGEAFGLYQLESLSSGIPIVQPDLGAFPEIVNITKGGVTFHPNNSDALAQKWEEILSDHEKINEMSMAGRKAVEEKFNILTLTENMLRIYKQILE